jgi:proteasome accessory factor C
MIEQAKILRVLKLISLLSKELRLSLQQLADELGVDKRTIYRYLKLLEECGFIIDNDFEKRPFIHQPLSFPIHANFSNEELHRLRQLIGATGAKDPLLQSILTKVYEKSELAPLKDMLWRARLSQIIDRLKEAIELKRQVVVKNYHSAHSSQISDRLLEPIEIAHDYSSLLAYEPDSGISKFWKLDRMAEVIILDQKQQYQKSHERLEKDLFGMGGKKLIQVQMQLSLRAYNLLREDYPAAIDYLSKDEEGYYFTGPVRSYEGIGRFILGLPGEAWNIKPSGLIRYLQSKLGECKLEG